MKKYQNSDFEQDDYEYEESHIEQKHPNNAKKTLKKEKYEEINDEYEENGFKNYLIKYKNSPFFIPTIALLLALLLLVIILKIFVWTPGKLKNIKVNVPEIVYMGEHQAVTAKGIGKGNLAETTYHFDISNNSIVELESKAGKTGKTVNNIIIPLSTGKFLLYVDASLNENEVDRIEKEITICKKMTNASVQKTSINIVENKNYQINLDLGTEKECYENIKYSVADENIATVDENGLITGISEGKTKIILKKADNEIEIEIEVNVIKIIKEIKVTDIKIDKNNITLEVGMTSVATATVLPENATNKGIKWESSNNSIATVSNKGVIKGIGKGNATITATTVDGNYKKSINVNITKKSSEQGEIVEPQSYPNPTPTPSPKPTPTDKTINATSINLNKITTTILVGKTEKLSVMITPLNVTDKKITWISQNEKVATVKDGVITGKKVGITNIIAKTSNGKTATVKVYVKSNNVSVSGIDIPEKEVTISKNESKIIVATISPSNATNQKIYWKSTNSSIATVKDGKIAGIKVGETTITATTEDGNYSKEIKVKVIDASSTTKDTIPPVLNIVTIKSDDFNSSIATKGNTIVLTIVANENLSTAPSVEINGKVVSVIGNNNVYNAIYNVDEDIKEEKEVTFKITNYSDISQNTGEEVRKTTDGSKVTLKK